MRRAKLPSIGTKARRRGGAHAAFDDVRRVCVSSTGSSYLPRRRRDHCVIDRGEPQLAVSPPGLKLPPDPSQQEEEDRARVAAAEAAIQAIEQAQHDMGEGRGDTDLYADAGARIMELYRQRIDGRSKTGEERALARRMDEIERKLRLAGLRAERTELYRIARSHKFSDETARKLVREIDLLEARFGTR
jgi:hypothetical protein